MSTFKIKTTTGKTVEITIDELLGQMLHFCRAHYAEHSSEIKIGENAHEHPEFLITPCKRQKAKD